MKAKWRIYIVQLIVFACTITYVIWLSHIGQIRMPHSDIIKFLVYSIVITAGTPWLLYQNSEKQDHTSTPQLDTQRRVKGAGILVASISLLASISILVFIYMIAEHVALDLLLAYTFGFMVLFFALLIGGVAILSNQNQSQGNIKGKKR